MGGVVRDVVALTELQVELLQVDAREAVRRVLMPLALMFAAGVVALCTVPMLLLLIAEVLVATTGMPYWLALLIVVILGFVVAGIVALLGWESLRSPLGAFQRSRDELARNIDWLKRTVAQQATADTRRDEEYGKGVIYSTEK